MAKQVQLIMGRDQCQRREREHRERVYGLGGGQTILYQSQNKQVLVSLAQNTER